MTLEYAVIVDFGHGPEVLALWKAPRRGVSACYHYMDGRPKSTLNWSEDTFPSLPDNWRDFRPPEFAPLYTSNVFNLATNRASK